MRLSVHAESGRQLSLRFHSFLVALIPIGNWYEPGNGRKDVWMVTVVRSKAWEVKKRQSSSSDDRFAKVKSKRSLAAARLLESRCIGED